MQFGYHLMVDIYNASSEILSSMERLYDLLVELPKIVSMNVLIPPLLVRAESNEKRGGKDPGGITGFTLIAESHISLHSFPKRRFCSMDIYSCKEFNKDIAIRYICSCLETEDIEINFTSRGNRYPASNLVK